MQNTYAQKQKTAQKKDASTAAAVLDTSSQSEGLQRKADMANNAAQYFPKVPSATNTIVQRLSDQARNRAGSAQQHDRHLIPHPFMDLGGWYKSLLNGRVMDLFRTQGGLGGHWIQISDQLTRLVEAFPRLDNNGKKDALEYLTVIKKMIVTKAKETSFAFDKIYVTLLNGQVFSVERKVANGKLIVVGM